MPIGYKKQMAQSVTSVRSFTAVEQLDEFHRELAWPLEYRQLQAGSFSSKYTEVEGGDWFLMEEIHATTVELDAGSIPDKFVMVI